jgi:hypothetical protein
MSRLAALAGVTAFMLGLAACGEKPQTAATRKPDTKVWQGADNAFAASGWKSGDQTSWEEQMRIRAQAQDEYAKTK